MHSSTTNQTDLKNNCVRLLWWSLLMVPSSFCEKVPWDLVSFSAALYIVPTTFPVSPMARHSCHCYKNQECGHASNVLASHGKQGSIRYFLPCVHPHLRPNRPTSTIHKIDDGKVPQTWGVVRSWRNFGDTFHNHGYYIICDFPLHSLSPDMEMILIHLSFACQLLVWQCSISEQWEMFANEIVS